MLTALAALIGLAVGAGCAAALLVLRTGSRVHVAEREAETIRREAHIEARGTVVERNGKPALDLRNGSFLELAAKPSVSSAESIDVAGVSRVVEKEREVLTLTDRE